MPKLSKVQLVLADVCPHIKFLTLHFKCVLLRGPTRPVIGYIRYFMSKEDMLSWSCLCVHIHASVDTCIHLWFPCSIRTIKTNFMGFCLQVITFEFLVIANTDITVLEISVMEGTLPPFNMRLKFLCDKDCVPLFM